ncbi:Bacteriophage Lambda NinG protein [compost metagenome]
MGCVSCDRGPEWDGQFHASHFRSVGACSALRFEPLNIHKACSICNNHLSGNILGFRPELIRRIGLEKVEWLEAQHEPRRWTIEELQEIKATYRARVREMKKEMQ